MPAAAEVPTGDGPSQSDPSGTLQQKPGRAPSAIGRCSPGRSFCNPDRRRGRRQLMPARHTLSGDGPIRLRRHWHWPPRVPTPPTARSPVPAIGNIMPVRTGSAAAPQKRHFLPQRRIPGPKAAPRLPDTSTEGRHPWTPFCDRIAGHLCPAGSAPPGLIRPRYSILPQGPAPSSEVLPPPASPAPPSSDHSHPSALFGFSPPPVAEK